MTRYLLDTDTLIDFSKGLEPTRSRILEMINAGDILGVCAINIAEFYTGLPEEERPTWNEFFESLAYWEISRGAAKIAGTLRYDAARAGQIRTTSDCLVAAVATEKKAIILTANIKDYPSANVRSLRSE